MHEDKTIKTEIINLLMPIFGDNTIKFINNSYDDDKPEEIINLANNLLSGVMGEQKAKEILANLIHKKKECLV